MNDTDNVLKVRNLRVSFDTFAGTVHAIRDVSFVLHRGETLALVGESGSGKSVTCRAVMRPGSSQRGIGSTLPAASTSAITASSASSPRIAA